jgi:hypothetical protein
MRRCKLHGNGRQPKHFIVSMPLGQASRAPMRRGIRRCGLRQARYIGLAKTHSQHLATAAALNVVRLGEWLTGTPRAKTRCSPFAALKAA